MYIGLVMLVRNTYASLLVPDSSPFEVKITIAKLTRYKLPISDQILAEFIQADSETLQSEISKHVNSV
jgi:hypothetical protein